MVYVLMVVAFLGLIAAAAIGWVLNIIALIHLCQVEPLVVTGMLILRGIGIFLAPLGAILGYF